MAVTRLTSRVNATLIACSAFGFYGCAQLLNLDDLGFTGATGDESGETGAAGSAGAFTDGGSSSGGGGTSSGGSSGATTSAGRGGSPGYGPSCNGRDQDPFCGASLEDCCASFTVEGGTWNPFGDMPIAVSTFRLDKFEVTVGRFRNFVEAVIDGFRPAPGSGTHTHLPGQMGVGELGWQEAWDARLPTDLGTWSDPDHLGCPQTTWTQMPASGESLPIVCVDWFQARAFCTWDGGFLPSQLELAYAADGGNEQRPWPWGDEPLDPSRAVYGSSMPSDVGSKPDGDGRWEQSDLIGSVWEWPADNHQLIGDCTRDCMKLDPNDLIKVFGGGWSSGTQTVTDVRFYPVELTRRESDTGFRCARAP